MPRIAVDTTQERYEILKEQKEELGLTWEEALIRGLSVGPTPLEKLGFPDPLADVAQAPARDEEFLRDLEDTRP